MTILHCNIRFASLVILYCVFLFFVSPSLPCILCLSRAFNLYLFQQFNLYPRRQFSAIKSLTVAKKTEKFQQAMPEKREREIALKLQRKGFMNEKGRSCFENLLKLKIACVGSVSIQMKYSIDTWTIFNFAVAPYNIASFLCQMLKR